MDNTAFNTEVTTIEFDLLPSNGATDGEAKDLRSQVDELPNFVQQYVAFIVVAGILYSVNLIFINPVTVCCHVGFCLKNTTQGRKKSKQIKNQRIKKYLDNSYASDQQSVGEIEIANNVDNKSMASVSSSVSKFSQQSTPSRQSVVQF